MSLHNRFQAGLLLLAFAFVGCDGLLEETPEAFISPTNFYTSPADAVAAVNSVYDQIGSGINSSMWFQGQLTRDASTPDHALFDAQGFPWYRWSSGIPYFWNMWQEPFRAIASANAVLGRVPAIQMDETLKKRVLGEARFLRAYSYFDLVRNFGGVPIFTEEVTTLENLERPRSSVAEVYDVIVKDLQEAEAALPASYPSSDMGRATRGAAKAYLAKVYATMAGEPLRDASKWSLAAAKAKEVIDGGTYDLLPSFASVFTLQNENSKESIFELQFKGGLGPPYVGEGFNARPSGPGGTGKLGSYFGWLEVRTDLIQSFEPGDKRAEMIVNQFKKTNGEVIPFNLGKYFSIKHITQEQAAAVYATNDAEKNYAMFRFADLLLLYAEALNEAGGPTAEAYTAINRVRARAGLPALSGLTKEQFRQAVRDERRHELYNEGHRLYDLRRWGLALSSMRALNDPNFDVQDHETVFPLPQRALDSNELLEQNPGY